MTASSGGVVTLTLAGSNVEVDGLASATGVSGTVVLGGSPSSSLAASAVTLELDPATLAAFADVLKERIVSRDVSQDFKKSHVARIVFPEQRDAGIGHERATKAGHLEFGPQALEFVGDARRQVAVFAATVEKLVTNHPDAASYRPGRLL
jgi:hypothetical protein